MKYDFTSILDRRGKDAALVGLSREQCADVGLTAPHGLRFPQGSGKKWNLLLLTYFC